MTGREIGEQVTIAAALAAEYVRHARKVITAAAKVVE